MEGKESSTKENKETANIEESRQRPVLCVEHFYCITFVGVLMLLGSFAFPTINRKTLKPGDDFPLWLRTVSRYTNKPIKIGLIHLCIYSLELFREKEIFMYHTGQRLSTLWLQLIEHERWGQHLHMQLETALQIIDLTLSNRFKFYSQVEKGFLYATFVLFLFLHLVTSSAYHTWEEQLIGYIIAVLKVVLDYSILATYNREVGKYLCSHYSFLGGFFVIALLYLLTTIWCEQSCTTVTGIILHPTSMATTVFGTGASLQVASKRISRLT